MSVTQRQRPTKLPTYGLMTPREAAVHLRVTPRTVARWCRDGKLRAIKVGRVWRVRTWDGAPIIEP
jgi:excisionase family DNA binding protein